MTGRMFTIYHETIDRARQHIADFYGLHDVSALTLRMAASFAEAEVARTLKAQQDASNAVYARQCAAEDA